jgi:hypothetical protein
VQQSKHPIKRNHPHPSKRLLARYPANEMAVIEAAFAAMIMRVVFIFDRLVGG